MAIRRMFSSRVTESTRFVKMPATSQNLYFHLGMKADDDGVVEAYPVMCIIGASEDDLRVLVSKGFVTILNEDMVAFLNDWLENNNIRKDRKTDSIYKELLLKVIPEVELKEPKKAIDHQVSDICQPNDSIGKDRLGKDSIINNSSSEHKRSSDKHFDEESREMKSTRFMIKKIREMLPKFKEPNIQKWCKSFDYMYRIDERDPTETCHMLNQVYINDFWRKNILSPDNLRKQYNRLWLELDMDRVLKELEGMN